MNKKSSEKWHKKYQKKYKRAICDPDGWDRKDFDNSWNEKITWKEFCNRAIYSTCMPVKSMK
jgi:hypothetical protein